MKKSFVAILLILCCAFAGCTAGGKTNGKTEREKIPTTTDVLTIDQNKYMFGLSELSSEMNGGVDVEIGRAHV